MQIAMHNYHFLTRRIDMGMYYEHEIKAATDTVIHYFTSYTTYLDYCHQIYPEKPFANSTVLFYDNCATAYLNHHKNLTHIPSYPIYGDLTKIEESKQIKTALNFAGYAILGLGCILNQLKIELSQSTMTYILLPLTVFMSIPDVF